MQTKTETVANITIGSTGAGLALTPAFYETEVWLGAVAILGMTVLILTAINAVFSFRRNLKLSGKERRDND